MPKIELELLARHEMEITAAFPLANASGSEGPIAETGASAEFALMLGSVADPPPIPDEPSPPALPAGEGVANPGPIAQPQRLDLLPSQSEAEAMSETSLKPPGMAREDVEGESNSDLSALSAAIEALAAQVPSQPHFHAQVLSAPPVPASSPGSAPQSPLEPIWPTPRPIMLPVPPLAPTTGVQPPFGPPTDMPTPVTHPAPIGAEPPTTPEKIPYGRLVALEQAHPRAQIGPKFFAPADSPDQVPLPDISAPNSARVVNPSMAPEKTPIEMAPRPFVSPNSAPVPMPSAAPQQSAKAEGQVGNQTVLWPNDPVVLHVENPFAAQSAQRAGKPGSVSATGEVVVATGPKPASPFTEDQSLPGPIVNPQRGPVQRTSSSDSSGNAAPNDDSHADQELVSDVAPVEKPLDGTLRAKGLEPRPNVGETVHFQAAQPRSIAPGQLQVALRQIIDRIEFLAARPREAVTILLRPEHLGTITLTIKSLGSAIDAQIAASEPAVKQALEQSQAHLAAGLEQRGYTLSQIQITQAAPAASGHSLDAHARHQQDQAHLPHQRHQGHTTQQGNAASVPHDLSRARQIARSASGVDLWI